MPSRFPQKRRRTFIQEAHRIHGRFSHHHAGADAGFDLDGCFIVAEFTRVSIRKYNAKQRLIGEKQRQGWEIRDGVLLGAVRIQELPADHCRVRVVLHEMEKFLHGAFAEHGIGVEQQRVAALDLPERKVVGGGKSEIPGVLNHPDLWNCSCAAATLPSVEALSTSHTSKQRLWMVS